MLVFHELLPFCFSSSRTQFYRSRPGKLLRIRKKTLARRRCVATKNWPVRIGWQLAVYAWQTPVKMACIAEPLWLGTVKLQQEMRMQKALGSWLMGVALLLAVAANIHAQTDADRAAIKQTALDYIEGFYEGNPERMERSLHPELAKRIVRTEPSTGKSQLEHMTAARLVQVTGTRKTRPVPPDKQQKEVTILDQFENAASVKIVANDWIDYLHIAKFDGRWVIVNVLWEMKPQKK
jgi:hypothetical protein